MNKLIQCLINGCNQCYPEAGTHYDSEVEISEEEGEESDEEEEEEPYGSNCASEKESQNSTAQWAKGYHFDPKFSKYFFHFTLGQKISKVIVLS